MNGAKNTEKLIEELNKFDESHRNGAVILHFDKETNELKSISPLLPVKSIDELYDSLKHAREAINHFLNDLVNKGLHKN